MVLLGSSAGSRPVCAHNEIDVTVQDMKKGQQLVYCLSVVGLVQESVELRRGRSQSADDLPLRQGAGLNPLLGFDGELVEQRIPQIAGILVVFQDLLEVHRSLQPRRENIGEPFPVQFLVHNDPREGVLDRRLRIEFRVGQDQRPSRGLDLKYFLAVVAGDRSDLHSRPSDSSSPMSSTTLRGASPFIGLWFSRSHFTTNVPSRSTCKCREVWSPFHVTNT